MNDNHFLLILLIAHWYSRKFKMHWVNLGLKNFMNYFKSLAWNDKIERSHLYSMIAHSLLLRFTEEKRG